MVADSTFLARKLNELSQSQLSSVCKQLNPDTLKELLVVAAQANAAESNEVGLPDDALLRRKAAAIAEIEADLGEVDDPVEILLNLGES